MARRSGSFVRHPARTAVVSVGCAIFFGAIAGGRALLLPSTPMTWIVDDDGGPGVHFTDIQPALDAALDGDLVLVRPGGYGSFTLSENLSIVGEEGVRSAIGTVTGVDGEAGVAEISFKDFEVSTCPGTVVLDSLLFHGVQLFSSIDHPVLTIRDSADVRVLAADSEDVSYPLADSYAAVFVDDSNVELVSCLLAGSQGKKANSLGYAGDGGAAISIQGGGRVYVARIQATGGKGGDASVGPVYGYGGEGGAGIDLIDGDVLLLGRGSDVVQGGKGGAISLYGYGGDGGDGVRVGPTSSARYSQVIVKGGAAGYDPNGASSPGAAWQVQAGGASQPALPPDPALERIAVAQAGGAASIKLRTQPGVFSRLFVGNVPIVQATPNVFVDSLVVKEASYALGFAPATGVVNASFPLDPAWTPGTVVYAQAMSIFPGGQIRRTNSVPFVVR